MQLFAATVVGYQSKTPKVERRLVRADDRTKSSAVARALGTGMHADQLPEGTTSEIGIWAPL